MINHIRDVMWLPSNEPGVTIGIVLTVDAITNQSKAFIGVSGHPMTSNTSKEMLEEAIELITDGGCQLNSDLTNYISNHISPPKPNFDGVDGDLSDDWDHQSGWDGYGGWSVDRW